MVSKMSFICVDAICENKTERVLRTSTSMQQAAGPNAV